MRNVNDNYVSQRNRPGTSPAPVLFSHAYTRLTSTVFKNGNTPIHAAFRTYDDFNRLTGINGYSYTLNDKDQRTKLTLADDTTWDYTYDGFSQVIGGVKKDGATELANHAYSYDTIGNRVTATTGAAITEYTANLLNQYTAIDEEVPTYDLDGNMLTNGEWTYTWNIENRLTAAENATTKLEYLYDFMGRRTTKKVYTKTDTAWTLQTTKTFVYDGFKQIAELTGNTVTMHTVWQPPSSGDFDVPLWTKTGTTVQVYILDGNKNVRQLKNTAGTVIASYDYDPFGNVTATGATTPWQFSSEYRDEEAGLVYYNYRYYDPKLGRWLRCDPIGQIPLYVFLHNDSITINDKNGLSENNSQDCCGTDVTEELDTLITTVIERLSADEHRSIVFDICMFHPGTGWDFEPFRSDGENGKATTKCSATRTYHEKCYKSTSMNYILWGLLTGAKIFHRKKIEDELRKYPIPGSGFPGQPPNLGIIDPLLSHWLALEAYLLSKYFNHDEPGETASHANSCKRAFFFAGCNAFSSGKLDLGALQDCAIDCLSSNERNTESLYVRFYSSKGEIQIPSAEEIVKQTIEKNKKKQ